MFSTVFSMLPGTGIIAAITGVFSRDKLVSFLVGFLPSLVFLFFVLAGPPSEEIGFHVGYGLRISVVGLGFGLMGLGGAPSPVYGKSEPARAGQRTLRLGVLCGILGFSLWFGVVWGIDYLLHFTTHFLTCT